MELSGQEEMPTREEIIAAAREERWDFVDENLAGLIKSPEIIKWAIDSGLDDVDGNVRDLAASILEKSDYGLSDEEKNKLLNIINDDENPYARFRAAFALYKRGNRSLEVVAKVKEALFDPATKDIARNYLSGR